jgi:large subunit ribosomal protein L1
MADNIDSAIKSIRETEKRKFNQTIDLIINVKSIDLKKPENKFSKRIVLPHGRGKDVKVCIIGEKGDVTKDDVLSFERDKSGAKKLSKKYEFFICEAPIMPLVGKILGRYLAPKGKMPELLPPGKNPESVVEELKRSVRIRLKDSPSIQTIVGTENMGDSQIIENVNLIVEEIKKSLPPKAQIRNAFLKTTMGKPARIGV